MNSIQKLRSIDIRDYVSKQLRYSMGNVPSIPLGLFIIYAFTQWLGLWYVYSSFVSFIICTAINFNIQRLLRVVATSSKRNYLSKLARFYAGSVLLVPLGTGVLYAVTEYGHVYYLVSTIVSMICTTITGMGIQTALRVIKIKRHEMPESPPQSI